MCSPVKDRTLKLPANRVGQVVRMCGRFPLASPPSEHAEKPELPNTAHHKEALVTGSSSNTTWHLLCDTYPIFGGGNTAPEPSAFLITGLLTSCMDEIRALARKRNITLESISLELDHICTLHGSFSGQTIQSTMEPITLKATIRARNRLMSLYDLVAASCYASPLNGLMAGRVVNRYRLSLNERHHLSIPDELPATSEPADIFDRSTSAQTMTPPPIQALDPPHTPPPQQEPPSRHRRLLRIHSRGTCTLIQDPAGGPPLASVTVKSCDTQSQGFRMISDSPSFAENADAPLRAPEPAIYGAAGIGFCLMDQIHKSTSHHSPIKSCRIIQDCHLSLGGITSDTGKAGSAEPLETHIFLNTPAEFSEQSLKLSIQASFLNAFCLTALKPNIEVCRLSS